MTSAVVDGLRNMKGNTSASPGTNLALLLATGSACRCPVSVRDEAGAGPPRGGGQTRGPALHRSLPPQKDSWKENIQMSQYNLTSYSEHWRRGEESVHCYNKLLPPFSSHPRCPRSFLPYSPISLSLEPVQLWPSLHITLLCFSSESPLWPKENLDPVVVQEGAPLTLQCNPPPGLPSPVIFWMSSCKCGSMASPRAQLLRVRRVG